MFRITGTPIPTCKQCAGKTSLTEFLGLYWTLSKRVNASAYKNKCRGRTLLLMPADDSETVWLTFCSNIAAVITALTTNIMTEKRKRRRHKIVQALQQLSG